MKRTILRTSIHWQTLWNRYYYFTDEKTSTERLRSLLNVTQLVNGGAHRLVFRLTNSYTTQLLWASASWMQGKYIKSPWCSESFMIPLGWSRNGFDFVCQMQGLPWLPEMWTRTLESSLASEGWRPMINLECLPWAQEGDMYQVPAIPSWKHLNLLKNANFTCGDTHSATGSCWCSDNS